MSKQKQIQEYERKQLIDELSKMPHMVIATAYLHALNYTLYGVDVTEKWLTATHQAAALEGAYHEGYSDALEQRWIPVSERLPEENGQYLITVKYKPEADYENIYAEHGEWIDGQWDMFCFGHCGEVEGIVAWMPLPEPYKGESEVEEKNDYTRCCI